MASDGAENVAENPATIELAAPGVVLHKKSFISPVVAEVIGGVSSLLAGGVTARRLTEERAYKNISSLYYIEDLKKERTEFGPKIARQVESGALTAQQGYQRLQEGVRLFESKIDARLEKGGVKGFLEEFGLLRRHQKWEVVISALSAGGIALGAALIMTRGLFTPEQEEALASKGAEPRQNGAEKA